MTAQATTHCTPTYHCPRHYSLHSLLLTDRGIAVREASDVAWLRKVAYVERVHGRCPGNAHICYPASQSTSRQSKLASRPASQQAKVYQLPQLQHLPTPNPQLLAATSLSAPSCHLLFTSQLPPLFYSILAHIPLWWSCSSATKAIIRSVSTHTLCE